MAGSGSHQQKCKSSLHVMFCHEHDIQQKDLTSEK